MTDQRSILQRLIELQTKKVYARQRMYDRDLKVLAANKDSISADEIDESLIQLLDAQVELAEAELELAKAGGK